MKLVLKSFLIICPGLTIINFHYEFLTRAPNLSNQKAVFIGYDVLDVLPATRNKIILEGFVTIRSSLAFSFCYCSCFPSK
jgi:hypothetical protein